MCTKRHERKFLHTFTQSEAQRYASGTLKQDGVYEPAKPVWHLHRRREVRGPSLTPHKANKSVVMDKP